MIETLWFRVMCVAVGGAAGALLRWASYESLRRLLPESWSSYWHVGTLAANAVGCLVFGVLFASMQGSVSLSHPLRMLVFTGFLGAYTTYSAFAFDAYALQSSQGVLVAAAYSALQVAIGWGTLLLGIVAGRMLSP